ncbi:MAG TPA: type II toxin-antitoxin system YafQ family toxin [Candidatus Paceibacterota bacterium]
MYLIKQARSYKKSLKRIAASGNKNVLEEIKEVTRKLSEGNSLGEKYKDHRLEGGLRHYRECHIKPDILLIYRVNENDLILADIGSHSQLFG